MFTSDIENNNSGFSYFRITFKYAIGIFLSKYLIDRYFLFWFMEKGVFLLKYPYSFILIATHQGEGKRKKKGLSGSSY